MITPFKKTREIFANPYGLPQEFSFDALINLFTVANYGHYFKNSIIVAVVSIFFIVIISSLASYVLAKYKFIGNRFIYFYFIIGLVVPIRLGTIGILNTMVRLNLYDNIASLIIIYTAMGIPFGIFILTDFIRLIPEEFSNAARIDGCSEPKIFFNVIIPLLRPAIATVAIINFIPIWNDFWFPLVLISSDRMKTIPLAVSLLFGQYQTDYGFVFAVLSTASLPVVVFYLIFSRQLLKGLAEGGLK
ncbi:MAG: carbohydrate ABC transporter permease [Thermodesulfovibrionales bacterium]